MISYVRQCMRKANSMACLLAAAALLLTASVTAKAATLTVAVAANAQYAFAELAAAFEARSGNRSPSTTPPAS